MKKLIKLLQDAKENGKYVYVILRNAEIVAGLVVEVDEENNALTLDDSPYYPITVALLNEAVAVTVNRDEKRKKKRK